MAGASYVIPSFLGGEISKFAQGRYDKPDYRISMRVCSNSFPLEAGPWARRPGTRFAGTTLNGAPGRVIRFDFEQSQPYTLEFTDGRMRFRSGPTLVSGTLVTPYVSGTWADVRAVQAETTDILLHPTVAPQALTVTQLPSATQSAAFALAAATFNDGPYLDPFTNGVQVVPDAVNGIVNLALQFPAYSSTKAYAQGAFVTSASICYVSLADQNVNHTPAVSPTFWQVTSTSAAVNNGQGFLGSDVGRLVRLFSEPLPWDVTTAYVTGNIVSYNPSGLPGAAINFQAQASSTGKAPGSDLTNWQIVPQGASIWTWGKITSLTTTINPALAGGVNFGDMTGGGGLAAAFNGTFVQTSGASAEASRTAGATPAGAIITLSTYVGKDYSAASDQKIDRCTIYPSSDQGFASGTYVTPGGGGLSPAVTNPFIPTITFVLRGKATAPVNEGDGTALGSVSTSNTTAPVTIPSNDSATLWKYVWVQQIAQFQIGGATAATSAFYASFIAQISFFSPPGSGVSGNGVAVQILGPSLLRIATIVTWRFGAYSNTTGWPTCGVYFEGRLWLGGAIPNRFDGCVSNGINGGTVNFAPTDQYGVVAANAAISYTLNATSINKILWMDPDLQGIKMGTQAGEWLVQAPTAGSVAPNNITARNVTNHGSANIQPCRAEHTTIFVQRYGRKLLEYFPDVYSGKFSAPNLADKAEHLTNAGVAELAYTSAVTPIIWGRDNAGGLFGVTYKRDSLASAQPPTFYAWHRHALGSGRLVESVCSGPSTGGDLDTLTMVTNDPATGVRHVEILTDVSNEAAALSASWFLDDAVRPSTTIQVLPSSIVTYGALTLNGLSHLEGKTVQIFAGGLDLGDPGDQKTTFVDYVVRDGSVTVPFGDGVGSGPGAGLFTADFLNTFTSGIPIVVGFTYSSRGQPVRPVAQADTGARNGPGFGKLSREHRYAIQVVNTKGLSVGTTFDNLLPALFRPDNSDSLLSPLSTFTGIHADALEDVDSYDRTLCWEITRPFPATVTACGPNLDTKDQ